jgi:hypothetical protein
LCALGCRQVAVARGQRQAVGSTNRLAADDLDRQIEFAGHVANNHQLLVILLAEQRHVGLGDLEQLHDHRGDAAKMSGTELAVEDARLFYGGSTW